VKNIPSTTLLSMDDANWIYTAAALNCV
jgi:hypothetical protein